MKKAFFFIVLTILTSYGCIRKQYSITLTNRNMLLGKSNNIPDADGDAEAWFAIYPQGEEPYQSYPERKSMAYVNSNSECWFRTCYRRNCNPEH